VIALPPQILDIANAGNLYYGVENDPDHSSSAEDVRDAIKKASGTKGKLPIKQNRGGSKILEDLDKLAEDHGAGGKLDCVGGVFIFHYSGHGGMNENLKAVIGTPDDQITSDQVVDKLLEIVPECCTVRPLRWSSRPRSRNLSAITY